MNRGVRDILLLANGGVLWPCLITVAAAEPPSTGPETETRFRSPA